jgi:hypothetical protein
MRGNSRGTNRNIAAIDVTAAVPPGSLMNSRRFKGAPLQPTITPYRVAELGAVFCITARLAAAVRPGSRKYRRCCEAASELSDVCKIRSTVGTRDLPMRRHAKASRHAFLRGAFACPGLPLKNQFVSTASVLSTNDPSCVGSKR